VFVCVTCSFFYIHTGKLSVFAWYAYLLNTWNEGGKEYGILFICSLFREYVHLEYIRIHVIYRVNQAEYGIYILVFEPHKYVKIFCTRAWEVARTVVAPPSSVVKCLWEVFVWGFGVLFLSCVCVCVCVCRCRGCCSLPVCVCDLLIFLHRESIGVCVVYVSPGSSFGLTSR